MAASDGVVVIAGSIESLGALARLIRRLTANFPVPLVAHVHGLSDTLALQMMQKAQAASTGLHVVTAAAGDEVQAGYLFLAPAGQAIVFAAPGLLELVPDKESQAQASTADRLFESAARFHGSDPAFSAFASPRRPVCHLAMHLLVTKYFYINR